MFPSFARLRHRLQRVIADKTEQGYIVDHLTEDLAALPDSYDALHAFAQHLGALPRRADWPYIEPNDLAGIWAECAPERPRGSVAARPPAEVAQRIEAAFLGSVCGCILGKPLEVDPTLAELRTALTASGDWPLCDYISEATLTHLGRRHPSWHETVRERIHHVAPDDDINYTILGMLLLERYGADFTQEDIRALWLAHIPIIEAWGPERTLLLKAGMQTDDFGTDPLGAAQLDEWVSVLNPGDDLCGALIRVDAYGYACPGNPALAAELAWRDASWTHRGTGIYGAMFMAALLSLALVLDDREAMVATALQFVPQRSRFHHIVSDAFAQVRDSATWLEGYERLHGRYAAYAHCRVYQEIGTVINTLRFAQNVGDAICMQVSQGNDTDSFGARIGALTGAYFGPGHLEGRWLAPFGDTLHTSLALFFEPSLTRVAQRVGQLPHSHTLARPATAPQG